MYTHNFSLTYVCMCVYLIVYMARKLHWDDVGVVRIPVKGIGGRPIKGIAIVDGDYDGEWLSKHFEWRLMPNGYVAARGPRYENTPVIPMIYLHRLVASPPPHMWVRHINGDLLDNRSVNLEWVTPSRSAFERQQGWRDRRNPDSTFSTPYRGVLRQQNATTPDRFYVSIQGKYYGPTLSAEESARMYDVLATNLWGDKAMLNFPLKEKK